MRVQASNTCSIRNSGLPVRATSECGKSAIRGNIHDLSGHITHKREIVSLRLQGYDTPRIARKTRHAKESVDRYIRDCETIRMLTQISTNPTEIGRLVRLNPRAVQQYLELLSLDPPRTDSQGHAGEPQDPPTDSSVPRHPHTLPVSYDTTSQARPSRSPTRRPP
ncbi:DUF1670 domain-containing protein [bacterium]|nr:DUF1670 domain-containing protein [bacterium]